MKDCYIKVNKDNSLKMLRYVEDKGVLWQSEHEPTDIVGAQINLSEMLYLVIRDDTMTYTHDIDDLDGLKEFNFRLNKLKRIL